MTTNADDLVQRLRHSPRQSLLTNDAADEIERLNAEVALFKSELERANARCAEEHGLRELAERELAALRERIEMAPVIFGPYVDAIVFQPFGFESLIGHRVRLVRED